MTIFLTKTTPNVSIDVKYNRIYTSTLNIFFIVNNL